MDGSFELFERNLCVCGLGGFLGAYAFSKVRDSMGCFVICWCCGNCLVGCMRICVVSGFCGDRVLSKGRLTA